MDRKRVLQASALVSISVSLLLGTALTVMGSRSQAPERSSEAGASINGDVWSGNLALPTVSAQAPEPQPDEDGYTGPLPRAASGGGSPTEANPAGAVDWDKSLIGPQPDQDDPNAPPVAIDDWSPLRHVFATGSTLRPRDSDIGWNYSGYGCIWATGGEFFTLHLDLPAGSRIDYLRLYSYDASSVSDAGRALITRYDGRGDYDEYGHVYSEGSGGYESTLSAFIGHVVNTTEWSYVLMWRSADPTSALRLCGLRVAYRVPQFRVALPLVLRNAPQ